MTRFRFRLWQVAFYGLGLNTSIILQAIGFGSPSAELTGTAAVYENLKNISIGNMILSAAGLIPGVWTTFLVVDSWGRKPVQLLGFLMLTILYLIMGASTSPLLASPQLLKTTDGRTDGGAGGRQASHTPS